MHRQWRQTRAGHPVERALERHGLLGPQSAQQCNLLGRPLATVAEVLAERLVLDRVPTDPDSEAQPTAAEQVDFRGLLGHQRSLPLRQDDHSGDQFDRPGERGEEAEHHERLVKGGVDVVGAAPTGVNVRIRADDVVVGQDVA